MAQFKFRPIDRMEDRITPASPASEGFANVRGYEVIVRHVAEYIINTGQVDNPSVVVSDQIRDVMATIVTQCEAAAVEARLARDAVMSQIMADPSKADALAGQYRYLGGLLFQLDGVAAVARRIGLRVGTDFNPDPVTPPVTGPNDSGMVNTIPNPNSPNFIDQGNGLKIWDTRIGTGDEVAVGSNIQIFYTGWLLNGTRFDARRSPQAPIQFDLDGLIQGWQQGIPGMREGGIRRLYIPAALAYGSAGSGSSVPPNSDLVFEIKVISTTP